MDWKYYLGKIELPENPVDGDTVRIIMAPILGTGRNHWINVPYTEIKKYTTPEFTDNQVAFQVARIPGTDLHRVIDCKQVDELEPVGLAVYKQRIPTKDYEAELDPKATDKVVVNRQKHEGKVVTLGGQEFKHNEPRQDVIDMLKDMLERAESGELRSIVAVGDLSDGHLLKAFGGQPEQVMPLYAELTVAWQEFRERYIQS